MWKINRWLMIQAGADGGDGGGGADPGTPPVPVDNGTPPADGGTPPADGGTPPADGGTPPADGGTPPADGGTPPENFFSTAPEDWRGQMLKQAGYDLESEEGRKALGQLDRVSDFGVFAKNYLNAQDRIRKGDIGNGLPENPTDEQMVEYREAHGIPATADAYELQLEDGLVLGDDDSQIMSGIYDIAHASNIPAETMSAMTNAMLKGRQAQQEARMSQDGVDKQTTDRMLKDTWAGDFDTNRNMVQGLVNQLPETVRDAFASARMADGRAVFNSPEVMVAMAEWARKINPAATVVPNANNPMQSITDELATLKGRMSTDENWHKDTAAQQRYRDLLNAQAQMTK